MIRIIHTADNHLGIKYSSWNQQVAAEKAFNERFEALSRIVEYSNKVDADYFIIAGDLFDSIKQTKIILKRTIDILKVCNAAVVIIPGNHDYCEGPDSKLWKQFRELIGNTNIHLLNEFKPYTIESADNNVVFYPCFCQAKTAPENNIAWIDKGEDKTYPHIGIAHGNLEGLGLGGDKYFNMKREDLLAKGLALWLLGHIHVPFPNRESFTNENILMPGTHTPDGFDRTRAGGFFDIRFESPENIDVSFQNSGDLSFVKLEAQLWSSNDIESLKLKIGKLAAGKTLLKLSLSGKLPAGELDELNAMADEFEKKFLFFELENTTVKKIEVKDISKNFPEDSLPFKILNELAYAQENEKNALALEKGYELFSKYKQ